MTSTSVGMLFPLLEALSLAGSCPAVEGSQSGVFFGHQGNDIGKNILPFGIVHFGKTETAQ